MGGDGHLGNTWYALCSSEQKPSGLLAPGGPNFSSAQSLGPYLGVQMGTGG